MPSFLWLFPYCLRLFEEKGFFYIFGVVITTTATLKPKHHNFITFCGWGLWNEKVAFAQSMITSLLQLILRYTCIGEQPSLFTGHSYMCFLRAKCRCIQGCLLRYSRI